MSDIPAEYTPVYGDCNPGARVNLHNRGMVNTPPVVSFKDRMEFALEARGKDWNDLRKHVKLTRSGIKKWRDGTTVPSADHLLRTADWLDFNPRWLLRGELPQERPRFVTIDEAKLLDDYTKLGDDDRDAIRRHAASLRRGKDHPPNGSARASPLLGD